LYIIAIQLQGKEDIMGKRGRVPITPSTRRSERVLSRITPLELMALGTVVEKYKYKSISTLIQKMIQNNRQVRRELTILKRMKRSKYD
jgi:hypothetical protein